MKRSVSGIGLPIQLLKYLIYQVKQRYLQFRNPVFTQTNTKLKVDYEALRGAYNVSEPYQNRWLNQRTDILYGRFEYLDQTLDFGKLDEVSFFYPDVYRKLPSKQWYQAYVSLYIFPSLVGCGEIESSTRLLERFSDTCSANWNPGSVAWDGVPMCMRAINLSLSLAAMEASPDQKLVALIQNHLACCRLKIRKLIHHHTPYNHLLFQYSGLAFCALALGDKDDAISWSEKLVTVLDAQAASDGWHVEKSSTYHLYALYMLKLLVGSSVLGYEKKETATRIVKRMERAASLLTFPDGMPTQMNDAVFGVCPTPGELGLEPDFTEGMTVLPDSNIVRFFQAGFFGVMDTGNCGPSHLSSHGHADALSIELAFQGRRVLVDPGVPSYGHVQRSDYRGQSLHNAPQFEGISSLSHFGRFFVVSETLPQMIDSSLMPNIGSFRVGAYLSYSGSFDGRVGRVLYVGEGFVIVADGWTTREDRSCFSRFLLPDATGNPADALSVLLGSVCEMGLRDAYPSGEFSPLPCREFLVTPVEIAPDFSSAVLVVGKPDVSQQELQRIIHHLQVELH